MRYALCALMVAAVCAPCLRAQQDGVPVPPPPRTASAKIKLPASKIAPNLPLSARERATQMLNRFSYGPRPGDVERVLALGPDKWFEQQLNPAAIDDSVAGKRMQDYPTLFMTSEQVSEVYPDRNIVEQVAQGRRPYPADPLLAAEYEALVWKLNAEQQDKLHPAPVLSDAEQAAQKKANQAAAARIAGELFALPRRERMGALNAMPPGDRVVFAQNVGGDQRNLLMADFTAREREVVNALQNGTNSSYRSGDELAQAHIVRAILSERQLQEVMTDFWFNHFNIYVPKDSDQWYTTAYERDTIRPHVFGRFRDLLLATAESPAMMVYLDNWLSIGPDSIANGINPANPNSKPGKRGLNENYGREVMELHTVGVNGGYTQADVTHLSAILTGWGVDRPQQGGPFLYDAKKHEPGTKDWFGYSIDDQGNVLHAPAGAPVADTATLQRIWGNAPAGMRQGITALTLLAASPKTARFISYLLAQRFVDDKPPAALVDRMTATYLASDGDIKAVLHTLIQSPEFNTHRYFRNKVKMPDEFLASAFRATGTDPQNPGAMAGLLANQLGEPLYKALPPTGYYVTADTWMNTQALLARLNFADQLTHNRFANQKFDAARVLALSLMSDRSAGLAAASQPARLENVSTPASGDMGPDVALHVLETSLIGGDISTSTDTFIHSQLARQPATNPTETLNLLTALLLGSPEFQVR